MQTQSEAESMEDLVSASPTASRMIPFRLTSLAPELKYAIFIFLPDVPSAKALALTSSSFFQTFLDAQHLILTQVLQNEMDTEVLRDYLTALSVSQIRVWSKDAILKVVDRYFENSISHTSHKWKLSEALAISKMNEIVDFLASEFASSALFKNPTATGANATPSSSEMRRIKLTLHRYELYCNLFRRPTHDRMVRDKRNRNRLIHPRQFIPLEKRKVFFDKFSPWENAQLGCIHEFLVQEITTPFRDVAKHDVEWGYNSVPYIDDNTGIGEDMYKKSYVARGLKYVHRLVTANTYAARYEILKEPDPEPRESRRFANRLPDVLGVRIDDDGVLFKDYTEELKTLHIRPPFSNDSDCGPMEAWLWANSDSSKGQFYFRNDHRPLRQRGYVMWDLQRLLDWKLLENRVEDVIAPHRPGYPERLRREAERNEQRESFKERSRIWMDGGRGWWTLGDESHIRWWKWT